MENVIVKTDVESRFGTEIIALCHKVKFDVMGFATVTADVAKELLKEDIGIVLHKGKIPENTKPEVTADNKEILAQVAELEAKNSELEAKNAELEQTITDLKAQVAELKQEMEDVEGDPSAEFDALVEGRNLDELKELCAGMNYPESEWIGFKSVGKIKVYMSGKVTSEAGQ